MYRTNTKKMRKCVQIQKNTQIQIQIQIHILLSKMFPYWCLPPSLTPSAHIAAARGRSRYIRTDIPSNRAKHWKHWKNIGKTLEKHWKNIGKTLEKRWKNIGKTLEKHWKTFEKHLKNIGKVAKHLRIGNMLRKYRISIYWRSSRKGKCH